MHERELKLEVPHDFSLARMQPRLGNYSMSPVELQRLHMASYDIEDLRLARWGCSLQFRHAEGWTLKIPVPNETHGLVREEHVFPGDETQIPASVLDLGTAYFRAMTPAPPPNCARFARAGSSSQTVDAMWPL